MKKINLKLDELISEMKDIIHNNDRYCFSDTLVDIIEIVRTGNISIYWGIRQNGTKISSLRKDMQTWSKEASDYLDCYKITSNIIAIYGEHLIYNYSIEKVEL